MNSLTINDLEAKIAQVNIDLAKETGRKFEVLSEYKSYLEDEVALLKREQKDGNS